MMLIKMTAMTTTTMSKHDNGITTMRLSWMMNSSLNSFRCKVNISFAYLKITFRIYSLFRSSVRGCVDDGLRRRYRQTYNQLTMLVSTKTTETHKDIPPHQVEIPVCSAHGRRKIGAIQFKYVYFLLST